ncbi:MULTISPECIES: hypothetical protein [unclassified Flavobacterium]|uniref:hypothetical protein n=2 Tax=Flavobacterium TaxID=237 RepID=UPI00131C1CE4|nr:MULTISPECIES: hypothetical protein [unclassified Flavobacterium]
MKMSFRTKEESNKMQEKEFLKLTPVERVMKFFELIYFFKDFPVTTKEKNNNFIIIIKNNKHKLGQ